MSLLKSGDQFDILRIENTSAAEHYLDNEDMIRTLQDWDQKYGLEIVAADYDTIELQLRLVPVDALSFARQVYEFCPDIFRQGINISFDEESGFGLKHLAEQGYDVSGMDPDIDPTEGGIQILAQDVRKHRTVFLWWD